MSKEVSVATLNQVGSAFLELPISRAVEAIDLFDGWSTYRGVREANVNFFDMSAYCFMAVFGSLNDETREKIRQFQVTCVEVTPNSNYSQRRHMESDTLFAVVDDGNHGERILRKKDPSAHSDLLKLRKNQLLYVPKGERYEFCTHRARSSLWMYQVTTPWTREVRYD